MRIAIKFTSLLKLKEFESKVKTFVEINNKPKNNLKKKKLPRGATWIKI